MGLKGEAGTRFMGKMKLICHQRHIGLILVDKFYFPVVVFSETAMDSRKIIRLDAHYFSILNTYVLIHLKRKLIREDFEFLSQILNFYNKQIYYLCKTNTTTLVLGVTLELNTNIYPNYLNERKWLLLEARRLIGKSCVGPI
jgi:hypothetical protein